MSKARTLKCAVCGGFAGIWQQHWNRDTGWGICRTCVDWLASDARGKHRMTPEEITDLYGVEGINYAPKEAPTC